MSDNQGTHDSEGDWGTSDLDPREQADADRFLDQPSSTDDEPWSPPDRLPRGAELIGVETDGGETLDQRIRQEEPEAEPIDPTEPAPHEMVGGDDPDAIPAEDDVLGGPAGSDTPGAAGSAPEESAMRVVEGDEQV